MFAVGSSFRSRVVDGFFFLASCFLFRFRFVTVDDVTGEDVFFGGVNDVVGEMVVVDGVEIDDGVDIDVGNADVEIDDVVDGVEIDVGNVDVEIDDVVDVDEEE